MPGLDTVGHLAVGVPGTVSGLETALDDVRHDAARRGDGAGDPPAPSRASCWSRATPTCSRSPTERLRAPIRPSAAIFLHDGQPLVAGDRLVQQRSRAHPAAHQRAGAAGFYAGPVAAAIVAASAARQGHPHAGGPRPVPRPGAGADRMRLPRLPHRLGAAAELGRRDRLRDPERARGLSAEGLGLPLGARGARADRGDAARVRRSQQLSSATPISSAIRSSTCSTRATPRRSAPPSTRSTPASADQTPGVAPHEGSQHDALLDRRRPGQRGLGHLHAQRLVRRQGDGGRHRHPPQRRDGRLHRQARRAQPLRPGAGRSQRDRARQAAAQLDEPDDRDPGRQAGAGDRHARRQPHHHGGRAARSSTWSTTG